MKKNLGAFILFFCASFILYAQSLDKLYIEAESLLESHMYFPAEVLYKQINAKNKRFKDVPFKIELINHLSHERGKSLETLLNLAQTYKADQDPLFEYWMGNVYMGRYEFEEAIVAFESFSKKKISRITDVEDLIAHCRHADQFMDEIDDYEIHQLQGAINTKWSELTPVFLGDGNELIFASSRGSKAGEEVFKIYHATKQGREWGNVTPISILGTFKREHTNLEIVNSDNKLFMFNPKKGGDLYFSVKRNGKWTTPVEFDSKITATHLGSHFYINEHEDRIIFASEKNMKKKGLDLYQSFKDHKTGKWTKPAPFADIINSEYDEDSPYLSDDELTLYFSSRGHGSIGGYDLFKSTFDTLTKKWTKPVNLGFPINSPDDELHFKMNFDQKSGYFSSNRLHSKGEFDIYEFWEIEKVRIEGRVTDLVSLLPMSGAVVRFTPSLYTDEHFRSTVNDKGKYSMNVISDESFLVEIFYDGQVIYSDVFEIHEDLDVNTIYIKDFRVNKTPKRKNEEEIQIASNLNLSVSGNSEVKQVTEQIKKEQVAETTKPVVAQETTITSNTTPVKQETKAVERNVTTKEPEIKANPQPNRSNQVVTTTIQQLANYAVGSKVIIRNVYFEYGSAGLTPSSNTVLNELLAVLKTNQNLKVEIGGHTDSKGDKNSNLWLSQKRAESVRNWLISQGINPDRLQAKGYGSAQPLASNDDEEEGRELNRRIEIRTLN